MLFVYILFCADGTYYTGLTNDLRRRIAEHQGGRNKKSYTYKRLPVELVFKAEFTDANYAIAFEKKIKKWSAAKKEALIHGNFHFLPELAKKKNWNKSK
jgi:putative endonuclease